MDVIVTLVLVLVVGFVYFLPTVVGQGKKNAGAILVLNLLLGWTVVGWIAALVWASTVEAASAPAVTAVKPEAALCASCGKFSMAGSKFCAHCGAAMA